MNSERWRTVLLCLVLAVIFCSRIAVVEYLLSRNQQLPDSQLYEAYACSLLKGQYTDGRDGARRAPGYPAFLALSWVVTGVTKEPQDEAQFRTYRRRALWTQVGFSVFTCWLVFSIAYCLIQKGYFPRGTQWWTFAAAGIDPYAAVLSAMILSETVFTTLIVAAAWLATTQLGTNNRRPWVFFLLGIVCALAVLVRPSGLLLIPLAAACWFTFSTDERRMRSLALAMFGFVVTMAPWVIRNAVRYHAFIPTTLNVGESLYDGINPHATGASDMSFLETGQTDGMSEVERNRYWWKQATQFALQHPLRVAELAAVKFVRFWSPWPNESQFRSPFILFTTTLVTVPVLLAAIGGTWITRHHRGLWLLGWLPAGYFCLLHLAFVSSVRYRVPAMPFLELFAGAGLAYLCIRLLEGKR